MLPLLADLRLSSTAYGRLIGTLPSNVTCMPQHKVDRGIREFFFNFHILMHGMRVDQITVYLILMSSQDKPDKNKSTGPYTHTH